MRLIATHAGITSVAALAQQGGADTNRRSWLKRLGATLGLGMLAGPALAGSRGSQRTAGMDPFIGEIMLFAGNFAVQGYALCDGQLLSIAQNTALFSLLGTTYGGNGVNTFALPDLRSRLPMHMGQGPGLSPRSLGEMGGTESVTLLSSQMPAHTHPLNAANAAGTTDVPTGAVLAKPNFTDGDGNPVAVNGYAAGSPGASAAATSVGVAGGNQPSPNLPPYLVLNYQIALQGIYPSRA